MTNWLEAAFGLGEEAEPIAPTRTARQAPEIDGFWCVVRQPTGAAGDLGETVPCHYVVTDGTLRLCDEHGKVGDKRQVLAPDDEPRRVASRLRRAEWQNERSPFDRPLHQAEPYGGY